MNTLLSFFLNSKVKLLILVIVLVSLFAWHNRGIDRVNNCVKDVAN